MLKKSGNWIVGALGLFVAGALAFSLRDAWRTQLEFDDAYMFYRYATNIRHGLGVSWNWDGVHTFGETSPMWGAVVVLLSFLPMSASHALVLGSWSCSVAVLAAATFAVVRNARSRSMKDFWLVLVLVSLPLLLSEVFRENAVTGMETMLAAALLALFGGLALAWERGRIGFIWPASVGLALILTRPESALCVFLLPALLMLFGRGFRVLGKSYAAFAGLLLVALGIGLGLSRSYFGAPLPLGFYVKTGHFYEGYHTSWHPLREALRMLLACSPFLAAIALFARKADWRLLAAFGVPVALTFGYLLTVTQIMGWHARYYTPYASFFVIPALLLLDRRLAEAAAQGKEGVSWRRLWGRRFAVRVAWAVAVVVGLLASFSPVGAALVARVDDRLQARPYIYDPVVLKTVATTPLPGREWFQTIQALGTLLVAPLPPGASIAASEVGYLGVANPAIDVFDMEGLNDIQTARQGFSVERLLARKPDIIWMPHGDYTYQRGLLLTAPALYRDYDVYAGAGNYSIALLKDGPRAGLVHQLFARFWARQYPGFRMDEYLVRSASWTHAKQIAGDSRETRGR